MSDFLKSTFGGYFGNSSTPIINDFVGQYVEVGQKKLRIKRVIAEGKFRKSFCDLVHSFKVRFVAICLIYN